MDFSECMSRCREPKGCALLREDYLECRRHSKEFQHRNQIYKEEQRQLRAAARQAAEGKKRKNIVISEAYPESEYNPSRDVLDGDGRISIQDLLVPLHGKSGFSKLRKSMH
ncbi:hypothetical protein NMG60_11024058 [Bertholletia excelsa]